MARDDKKSKRRFTLTVSFEMLDCIIEKLQSTKVFDGDISEMTDEDIIELVIDDFTEYAFIDEVKVEYVDDI